MPEKPLAAPEQATPSMSLREFKLKPPEPITVLIPPEKAPPEMLKKVSVENGGLVVETPQGKIGVELYVFPATEGEQIPFLKKIFQRQKHEQPVPIQVGIESTVQYDKFEKGEQTPLMGWYPHVVLQDCAKYGVVITAPTSLVQQDWTELKERQRTSDASGVNWKIKLCTIIV